MKIGDNMGYCTNELVPDSEHPDGYTYRVVIETGTPGLARLNVAAVKGDSDETLNSQGTDLTAAECRALARMLLATAEMLTEEQT